MIGKPFKPPLLLHKASVTQQPARYSNGSSEPPSKKRRISSDNDVGATTKAAAQFAAAPKPAKSLKTFIAHRAPLGVVNNGSVSEKPKPEGLGAIEGYYTVLWLVYYF
jgi:hypothetical protein